MSTNLDYTLTVPKNLTLTNAPKPSIPHPAYDKFDSKLFFTRLNDESYNGKVGDTEKLVIINQILDECAVRVSLLGTRELVSNNEVEMPVLPIALDTVAERAIFSYVNENIGVLKKYSEDDLTETQRTARKAICQKLKNFYVSSDAQLNYSNPITRIFNLIRENFHPLDAAVNLIGSVTGWGIHAISIRKEVEQIAK